MMTLVSLACALLAVWVGLGPPSGRRLTSRLLDGSPAEPPRRFRRFVRPLAGLVVAGGAVAAGVLLAGARGAVLTLAGIVVTGTVLRLVTQRVRQASTLRSQTEVARACDRLASHLRVGQVPTAALAAAAADCGILREAREVQELGGDVTRVWQAQAGRDGQEGLRQLARAWLVSIDTGAPMSATLQEVATGLSADQDLRSVVSGELASPRATGKVMAVLPFCGVAMGYLLGGDPIGWLVADRFGWACLLGGLLLACAGVFWVEQLGRAAAASW
jgi:tight adherence protein B